MTSTLVVVPYEVAGKKTSQVTVTTAGATSAPVAVQVANSAPGIYTVSGDGTGQAIAFLQNGSLNFNGNPVLDGDGITILCTGEGLVTPAAPTGVPFGQSPPSPVLPISATVDGQVAQVTQAYSVPGAIGQFLVQIIPPSGISDTSATVQITVGSAMTQIAQIAVTTPPDDGSSGDSGSLRRPKRAKY